MTRLGPSLAALLAASALAALAASPARPAAGNKPAAADGGIALAPMPTDAECQKLPPLRPPFSFTSGEELEYDVDAMGANAGKLYMRVLPAKDGVLPLEASAKTNTLFAKIRRVSGGGTSYVNPRDLHPVRYVEDTTENELRKRAEVQFRAKDHQVAIDWAYGPRTGKLSVRYANDGLDMVGAIYLMRELALSADKRICFDVYGLRRLWRMDGRVVAREHVSLPLGEFEAWHLAGTAIRLDNRGYRREVHVWISDDAQRLPLVAMGVIDLGAVRATLNAYQRPGGTSAKAQGKETLKW